MDHSQFHSIQALFAARGLRCTHQRHAIYETLAASRSHPTADDLYQDVSQQVDGMSLATVYNTLEAFCNAGLAQKVPGSNGPNQYDATTENHLHLRCEKTGAVRNVPSDLGNTLLDHIPENLLDDIESTLGFKIHQVQIELVGEYQ